MNKLLTLFVSCTISTILIAQRITPTDSLAIAGQIADWNSAWNTKDYQLAAKWYSNNAVFTNAFGDKRIGRTTIESLLKEVFALPFVMAGVSETTNHQYQYIDANTIIVHTAVVRQGQKLPDGTVLADRQTTHLRVFVKTNETWQINAHLISDARDKQLPKH